jgi:hypothetical protein
MKSQHRRRRRTTANDNVTTIMTTTYTIHTNSSIRMVSLACDSAAWQAACLRLSSGPCRTYERERAKADGLNPASIYSSTHLPHRIAMYSVAPQPYTPQNNAASSSSDSEYFSYSSDASMAPIASSSTYNGYRSFEALDTALPGPSSASSIPFQPSAPALASLDVEDLFGFADDDSRAEAQTLEASATQIGNKQDGARSRASTSAAASGGHASDSSLSSEVASNPLLRQDLHKNGMCLSLLATRQYLS